ncbi:MAG: putative hydrolase, partial [Frankiales bacterium]|nr:putative hydrolase [Frankiales bacterium]
SSGSPSPASSSRTRAPSTSTSRHNGVGAGQDRDQDVGVGEVDQGGAHAERHERTLPGAAGDDRAQLAAAPGEQRVHDGPARGLVASRHHHRHGPQPPTPEPLVGDDGGPTRQEEPVTPVWRDVDVDGARVRLLEAGEGDPLLFLHGWGLSPRSYAEGVLQLTAAGLRVIAPCLPGFGGSDGPPLTGIHLAAYAHRVGRLLDVLEVEHPAFVVGHSFGGGVALQLATDRPERVRSLTLVNSVGGAPGVRRGMVDASWLRWAVGTLGELDPADLARSAPGMLRDFLPNLLRKPLTLALTGRLALTASLAQEAEALVARGLPVLFVWGDDDRVVAPGALADVVGDLPAEVVRGRHGWLLSQPREFADLLRNALVVHAMLERRQRGSAVVLPAGTSLADLLPHERRSVRRAAPGTLPA